MTPLGVCKHVPLDVQSHVHNSGRIQTEMPVRDRKPFDVIPTSEARRCLSATSKRFRERGADADPVFFGPHRKPSGVILSYERYLGLLDALDDLAIALEVRKRDRADTGDRLSFEDLVRSQGILLEDLAEPE